MNSFIESLNQLGGHFLNFAWPMLWQSSLLIALVFALDLLLARKIRATVRHALWLVVLVKLLLPPTLALPTGAAWWLFPAKPPVKATAQRNFIVTYDQDLPLPAFIPPTLPLAEPPPPKLDRAGWTLLATVAVGAGLLLWLLCRWAQVVRIVSRATPSSGFSAPIDEARRLAGLRGPVRVKIVDDRMSPAVCGLFRPVILLPRTLAENLSADQLRAVLLHEAIHIRRGDIWVNFAQALLQVAYWWHPLVWVANARIRRVREEAVDDAVMLALAADAEIYAPTLLEVARLALRRPLLSLGLVGILESRSALRQRIERLLAFRAPRKAGLTLASLCGIFVFSAVALPMGEGPARVGTPVLRSNTAEGGPGTAPASPVALPMAEGSTTVEENMAADASPPQRNLTPPAAVTRTNPPAVLVVAEIYQMPMDDFKKFVAGLHFNPGQTGGDGWWSVPPEEFSKLSSDLKENGQTPVSRPRILTTSGKEADFFVGNDTRGIELDCLPVVNGTHVDLTVQCETKNPAATNRVKVSDLLPDKGGLVMRIQNGASNAVVCLSVATLTNGPTGALVTPKEPLVWSLTAETPNHGTAATSQPWPMPARQTQPAEATRNPPVFTGPGRQAIMAKLGSIRLGKVAYDGLPLNEVLKQLSGQCKVLDPEHKGVNFLIKSNPDRSGQPAAAGNGAVSIPNIDPNTGLPAASTGALDVGSFLIKIPSLNDVRLADVLDAIVLVADHPVKYSVQDFAIVFSARGSESSSLAMRTFRADPNTFDSGLDQVGAKSFGAIQNSGTVGGGGGGQNQNNGAVVGVVNPFGGTGGGGRVDQAAPAAEPAGQKTMTFRLNYPKPEAELKTLLSEAGVNLPPTRFIYNARAGLFAIRGTPDQLALVNRLVLKLNGYAPQDIQTYDAGFVKSVNTNYSAIEGSTNLYTRTFRVDPNTFYLGLESASASFGPSNSPSSLARSFFASLGVNLTNPPGKAVFFNDKLGYLFVKATESDLDTIEKALQVLSQTPLQVHIKARFIEVSRSDNDQSGFEWFLGQFPRSGLNSIPAGYTDGSMTGILTAPNFQVVLHALQVRTGVETLGEPEITTLSGRQTQMRATDIVAVVTNWTYQKLGTNHDGMIVILTNSIAPQSGVFETGPILDVVPYVLADGYTINLTLIPSLTEFLGYDKATNTTTVHDQSGEQVSVPEVLPSFRVRQISTTLNVWDNQTVILSGLPEKVYVNGRETVDKSKLSDKKLVVFITATIVDPAGRRVHSEADMPFAQDAFPVQPEPQQSALKSSSAANPVGDFPPYHNGDPSHPDP